MITALAILAVLAAAVIPVVVQQIERASPVRVARDLAHLRIALEQFELDTGTYPLYLSHLVNPITTDDSTAAMHLAQPEYRPRQVAMWNGPYAHGPLAAALRVADAYETGYGRVILNDLYCFDIRIPAEAECDEGAHVAIRINDMLGWEFDAINAIVDGEPEPGVVAPYGGRHRGRLRLLGGDGIEYEGTVGDMYYLAAPIRRR